MPLISLLLRCFFALAILFPVVTFSQDKIVASFNDVKLYNNVKISEKIATRIISFSQLCTSNCSEELKILPFTPLIKDSAGGKEIILQSRMKGLYISIETVFSDKNRIDLAVSLVRGNSTTPAGGRLNDQNPVAVLMMNNKEVAELFVEANIYIPGCEVKSGDINVKLDPISINEVKIQKINMPISSGSSKGSIAIMCNPGTVNNLLLQFSTLTNLEKVIIPQDNVGVGFMLRNGLNNDWIGFSEHDATVVTIPESGNLQIPLEAFYVRYSNSVKAGHFSAKAQYTITYK